MGQYWKPVNLDKREFLNPHDLGAGLKLWEQLANPGVGQALVVLLAVMPGPRGGGDFEPGNDPDGMIGRWAGDRVVLVGDYAEDSDFETREGELPFSELYTTTQGLPPPEESFTDITARVAAVIEKELGGKFVGSGWKDWEGD